MKRLNPKTNKPFEYGFIREDGKRFSGYHTKSNTQGFFYEYWRSESREHERNRKRLHGKEVLKKPNRRAQQLFKAAKIRAKKKNIEIDISVEWIKNKLNLGYCELTKLKFDLNPSKNTHMNPYAPSLDRINSDQGYTKKNVRVVLASVNTALGQYGEKTILPILKSMVKAIEKNAKKI